MANSWVNVKPEWLAIFQETRSFVIIFLPSLSSPSSFFPHDLWKSFDGPGSLKCTWLMSFYRSCSRGSSRIRPLSNDWQSCLAGMMHPSACFLTKAIQLLRTTSEPTKIVLIFRKYRGSPLTQKSLTRFPLTQFLAYVRVCGWISFSRGPQYSPTNTNFM